MKIWDRETSADYLSTFLLDLVADGNAILAVTPLTLTRKGFFGTEYTVTTYRVFYYNARVA